MKKIIIALIGFTFPSFLVSFLLRLFGCKIGKNFKIGFSFLYVDKLIVGDHVKIGSLNLILNETVQMSDESKIGYLNILKGPFALKLDSQAAIGNQNYFTRGKKGISYGASQLKLGVLTKITSKHHIDLTQSITMGEYSILAGTGSQMWTHGYYHANTGKNRIRIDGNIVIGNNVYIGSGCIFNPGVHVANAIHIGGGSVISKNLEKSGMYVGQGLRYIENSMENVMSKLKKVDSELLIEEVYIKK